MGVARSRKDKRAGRPVQLSLWSPEYDEQLMLWSSHVRKRHFNINLREWYEQSRPAREARIAELEKKPYALYRHFDCNGRLLYIGMTNNPDVRIRSHKRQSRWYGAIAAVTVEWITGFSKVCEAEVNAIKNEAPMYNVRHNDNSDCALLLTHGQSGKGASHDARP